jgi:hypothetical protein
MTGEKVGWIFKKLVLAYFENAIPATTWRKCAKSQESL